MSEKLKVSVRFCSEISFLKINTLTFGTVFILLHALRNMNCYYLEIFIFFSEAFVGID